MAKTAAPVAEVEAEEERDLTLYVDKAATDLQARFAAWIPEATGVNINGFKTKAEAFNEGVRLATALRMIFQASPENQDVLAERRAAVAAAKAAPKPPKAPKEEAPEPAPVARPAKAAKKAPAKKAAPAPEVDEDDDEVAEPVAKRPAKKAARRPAATDEAPF